MADYKELLRKAVQALPENNGASRRAVYEKARSALVGQLRAINPPLAARDITAHRLQLEDCIRQVEQEASEAVIAGMQEPPGFRPEPPPTQPARIETRAQGKPQPALVEPPLPAEPASIEDIIAAAEAALPQTKPPARPAVAKAAPATKAAAGKSTRAKAAAALAPDPEPAPVPVVAKVESKPEPRPESRAAESKSDTKAPKPNGKAARPLPSIVARAEAAKNKTIPPTPFAVPSDKPYDSGRRSPGLELRQTTIPPRLDPAPMRGQVAARQQMPASGFVEAPQVAAAMSAVREVEVEPVPTVDPQGAIDRAIATLDREARGEATPAAEPRINGHDPKSNGKVVEMPLPSSKGERTLPPERKRGGLSAFGGERDDKPAKPDRPGAERDRPRRRDVPPRTRERNESPFQRQHSDYERGGISALTIFLGVFAVLLVGAGGAGVWAWQEGYLNLDQMFARGEPAQQDAVVPQTADLTTPQPSAVEAATAVATAPEPAAEERLTPEPQTTPTTTAPLALVAPSAEQPAAPAEERLPVGDPATDPQTSEMTSVAALDPAVQAGSQSLLLEATEDGRTTAVPFSGTVDWSKGVDETGAPTIVAKATIPARNLGVDVLIRKNSDPSLPASHLMEITFSVTDTFIGGSIAHLPGVLLKNEELIQGAPLQGASARVVGNQFLFALSATAEDSAANNELLTTRRWIDLAIIYATGKRAIITLEKDEVAQKLFEEVFAAWGAATPASVN